MALTRTQPLVKPAVKPIAQPVAYPKVESAQAMLESAQADQAQMADVRLLLDSMFEREDPTIGLILDCLYDIGSIHWIDQRVPNPLLNRLAQGTARFSKPVAKIIALRWFKHNCPKLITNWLYTKVKFEPRQIAQVIEAAEAADVDQVVASIQAPLLAELDNCHQTISILRARVRLLSILLIGMTLTLGGGLAWSIAHLEQHPPLRNESSAP